MNIKLKDVHRAIRAIEKIDRLEEELHTFTMYRVVEEIADKEKELLVAYKFAVDELRFIVNSI